MCSTIKDELRLRKALLTYEHPEHFTTSQWRWPRPVYLAYRFVMAAYTIFAFFYSMRKDFLPKSDSNDHNNSNSMGNSTENDEPRVYIAMVFLTIWTYLLLTCHFVLAFIITAAFGRKSSVAEPKLTSVVSSDQLPNRTLSPDQGFVKENQKCVIFDNNENNIKSLKNAVGDSNNSTHFHGNITLPWYSKISWILSNIVSVFAIIVTGIYFGALFEPSEHGISFNDMNVHALNTVFIVMDNFISAKPVRLMHAVFPIVYGSVYVIFSAIFWACDNRNVIYEGVLDWNNAKFTVGVVAGIAVLIILLHTVNFLLYKLKLLMQRTLCRM